MTKQDKNHESRMRRMAKRKGYDLVKPRASNPVSRICGLIFLFHAKTHRELGCFFTMRGLERYLKCYTADTHPGPYPASGS